MYQSISKVSIHSYPFSTILNGGGILQPLQNKPLLAKQSHNSHVLPMMYIPYHIIGPDTSCRIPSLVVFSSRLVTILDRCKPTFPGGVNNKWVLELLIHLT